MAVHRLELISKLLLCILSFHHIVVSLISRSPNIARIITTRLLISPITVITKVSCAHLIGEWSRVRSETVKLTLIEGRHLDIMEGLIFKDALSIDIILVIQIEVCVIIHRHVRVTGDHMILTPVFNQALVLVLHVKVSFIYLGVELVMLLIRKVDLSLVIVITLTVFVRVISACRFIRIWRPYSIKRATVMACLTKSL